MESNKNVPDVHTVEPAEALHNLGRNGEKMVGDKWNSVRQQPSLIDESDRKTGEISSAATDALRTGTKPNM